MSVCTNTPPHTLLPTLYTPHYTTPHPNTQEHEAQEIPDIERNGYCFSDGCGTLSPDLAERVADCLAAAGRIPEDFVPSAFQIRWRGCKGMLTVDTKLRGMR